MAWFCNVYAENVQFVTIQPNSDRSRASHDGSLSKLDLTNVSFRCKMHIYANCFYIIKHITLWYIYMLNVSKE